MRYLYNRGKPTGYRNSPHKSPATQPDMPHMSPWLAVATMPEGLLETFSSRLQRQSSMSSNPTLLLQYFYLKFQADWQLEISQADSAAVARRWIRIWQPMLDIDAPAPKWLIDILSQDSQKNPKERTVREYAAIMVPNRCISPKARKPIWLPDANHQPWHLTIASTAPEIAAAMPGLLDAITEALANK